MKTILLPYGKESVPLEIEEGHLAGVLRSGIHAYRPPKGPDELVRDSLEHPIGAPRLRELAKGRRRVTVIASDHTRPVPSRVIMPRMLAEIRAGNPDAEITILVATGLHRATSGAELAAKFGDEIVARERIVVHDCDDQLVRDMHMIPAHGAAEAMEIAKGLVGKPDYTVAVIPDGVSVIVRPRDESHGESNNGH